MGHYIESATTRRARVLVYSAVGSMRITDLSGSGMDDWRYVLHSPTSAVRDFVSRRAVYNRMQKLAQ